MDPDRELFDKAFARLENSYPAPPKQPHMLESLTLPQWAALVFPHSCTVRRRLVKDLH